MHKPIKITVRRPEPEPEDFVQKIRLGTAPEEEAEQEDSAEPLERLPPRRGREKRAKGPSPPVGDSQQRAKGPTPVAKAEGKQEKARAASKEVAPKPVLPDVGKEPLFPNLGSERVAELETTSTQPEGGQEQQLEPRSRSAQSTPGDGLERSTMQQWLRWLSKQVSGVAGGADAISDPRIGIAPNTDPRVAGGAD